MNLEGDGVIDGDMAIYISVGDMEMHVGHWIPGGVLCLSAFQHSFFRASTLSPKRYPSPPVRKP